MNVVWEIVSNVDYLKSALSDENKITLVWIPKLFDSVKARRCVIYPFSSTVALHIYE